MSKLNVEIDGKCYGSYFEYDYITMTKVVKAILLATKHKDSIYKVIQDANWLSFDPQWANDQNKYRSSYFCGTDMQVLNFDIIKVFIDTTRPVQTKAKQIIDLAAALEVPVKVTLVDKMEEVKEW